MKDEPEMNRIDTVSVSHLRLPDDPLVGLPGRPRGRATTSVVPFWPIARAPDIGDFVADLAVV
jgi:hypothetical protein